jgi:hypothetical protein
MPFRTCTHIKEDGVLCQSPALRDHQFCYFHLNPEARRLKGAWDRAWLAVRLARAGRAPRSRPRAKKSVRRIVCTALKPME